MDDRDSIVIKRIPITKCRGSDESEKLASKDALFAEIKFLTAFRHPKLVAYFGVFNLQDCVEVV